LLNKFLEISGKIRINFSKCPEIFRRNFETRQPYHLACGIDDDNDDYNGAVQRQLLVLCETAVIYYKKTKTTAF